MNKPQIANLNQGRGITRHPPGRGVIPAASLGRLFLNLGKTRQDLK
jgi:hypothetical protein